MFEPQSSSSAQPSANSSLPDQPDATSETVRENVTCARDPFVRGPGSGLSAASAATRVVRETRDS